MSKQLTPKLLHQKILLSHNYSYIHFIRIQTIKQKVSIALLKCNSVHFNYVMKTSTIYRLVIFTSIITLPLSVFATVNESIQNTMVGIGATAIIINLFTGTVIKSLATLFLSTALLVFFYGIVEYIWAKRQGDGKGVENGNKFMTWGLIALFVMFSVYGIIKFGQGILFAGKDVSTIDIPSFNFKQGSSANVLKVDNTSPGNGPVGGSVPTPGNGPVGGSVTPTNCDNLLIGAECQKSNGTHGTCQDLGNGAIGCSSGGYGD